MIEPIQIGEHGETIRGCDCQYLGGFEKWEGFEPEREIGGSIFHDICHGWVDVHDISQTHRVLVCRSCKLRTVIPSSVKTYADLQEWSQKTYKE